jgi:hypothetical protein
MAARGTTSRQRKKLNRKADEVLGQSRRNIHRVRDAQIHRLSGGQTYRYDGNEDWDHPWRLSAEWDYTIKKWRIWVNPGFINGYPPTIAVPTDTLQKFEVMNFPQSQQSFGINPLTGKPYFSAFIFDKKKDPNEKQTQQQVTASNDKSDLWITDPAGPSLVADQFFNPLAPTVAFAEDGTAVVTPGSYPLFFKTAGVRPPDDTADTSAALGNAATKKVVSKFNGPETEGTSELRSCDIVLIAEHYAIKDDVYQADPSTGNVTIISAAFTSPPTRFPFRLTLEDRHSVQPAYPDILDKLAGNLDEPTFDTILIGRMFFVSPPNPPNGKDAVVDESWVPYGQHFCFWNLGYAQPNYMPAPHYDPITINIPLAGGLATAIGNQFLAPLNDAQQNILNALNQSSSAGYFWNT